MPNFQKGFDEADRGKDVRVVSVQESSTARSLCLGVPADKDNRCGENLPRRRRRLGTTTPRPRAKPPAAWRTRVGRPRWMRPSRG